MLLNKIQEDTTQLSYYVLVLYILYRDATSVLKGRSFQRLLTNKCNMISLVVEDNAYLHIEPMLLHGELTGSLTFYTFYHYRESAIIWKVQCSLIYTS